MYNDNNFTNHPLANLKAAKASRRYTLTQYLKQEEQDLSLNEYYKGRIVQCPVRNASCNIISANIIAALMTDFQVHNKSYWALGSKQLIYLPEAHFSLYPDVSVFSERLEYWDKHEMLLTNPLLIVEVLSKSTHKDDRTAKFEEYKTLPSFQEYLLMDPNKCHIETQFREEPDLWRDKVYKKMEDVIPLKSVGCTIPVNLIYKKITFKK